MFTEWFVLLVAVAYLCLLFAIAYYGDKRADQGRSLISAYVYALSMAVYCTSWTFYGSVGRAAERGMDFLAIYIGPTLTFVLWWYLLRKIIRISKVNRITSIADFISSRYGKSTIVSGLVTVIAVIGILPYISLQLKAVAGSFNILLPDSLGRAAATIDTAFLVALVMALFAILFGTRHIDASEHHEGMVVAIAFESIVKLVAFLAVGLYVTFGLFDGFGDLFSQGSAIPEIARLFTIGGPAAAEQGAVGGYISWITLTLLSMAAIICLPRQFQVTVVENVDERHLRKAVWLFPLYLLVINIFVLPIAVGGLIRLPGVIDAESFMLTIPMAYGQDALALAAFVGGLSAATGMVIVATIALSTMISNDLVMPVLLRIFQPGQEAGRGDLTGLILKIRRGSIVVILLLGYTYFHFIGESYALVTVGLVSFAAAAQFAPAIVGGIFWKGGTRQGALTGLSLGFLLWIYTLLLPALANSGWVPISLVAEGPHGLALLRPEALFGLTGLDNLSHALFWTMFANIGGYIGVSLATRQSVIERVQAALFVDIFRHAGDRGGFHVWRGTAARADLHDLVARFVGGGRADRAFAEFARSRGVEPSRLGEADIDMVNFTERTLAGAIGAASARVMIASVVKGEAVSIQEVMEILDEASQVIEYSHRLEQKSRELEATSAELRQANERLKELDRLKDEFLSTVSHELRTPLTSIRAIGEILRDNPEIDHEQRRQFFEVIVTESERLTRLINQILDLAKMEAGRMDWQMADIDPGSVIDQAIAATKGLFDEHGIALEVEVPRQLPQVHVDPDRFIQVLVNLLSNAVKFCQAESPRVVVEAQARHDSVMVRVTDNGPGIPAAAQRLIFEKFQQAGNAMTDKPRGTGLGLPICRQIVNHFGGRIWVESAPGRGATFAYTVPLAGTGAVVATGS
ncbi:MAG: histidine kinase [Inquilinus sp.]|nr:histidine kinase [Inquilinus sp.]